MKDKGNINKNKKYIKISFWSLLATYIITSFTPHLFIIDSIMILFMLVVSIMNIIYCVKVLKSKENKNFAILSIIMSSFYLLQILIGIFIGIALFIIGGGLYV